MLFSVVIPTCNRLPLLKEALESVWGQTFTDYEVLLVDDGSTDGTADFACSLGERITLLKQAKRGPGPARNLAVKYAKGEYIAFLDSDDLWFSWTLAVFAKLIEDCRRPSLLAARLSNFINERELSIVKEESPRACWFSDYFASSKQHLLVGANMMVVQRKSMLQAGGFPEHRYNAEDHDLVMRLGTAPGFAQVLSPITLAYRCHAASASGNLRDTYAGSAYLIENERKDNYPGGLRRALERREILTLHLRPVAINCVKQDLLRQAWALYRDTFTWHLRQWRWRFLLGFPVLAVGKIVRNFRLKMAEPRFCSA
jgi:glycosyltransferase involved in cell wall biosynthesis